MQTRARRIASRIFTVLEHLVINVTALTMIAALATMAARAAANDHPNLEGVWGMVQHDRLGAPFFIPVEPTRTPEGKKITDEFVAKYKFYNDFAPLDGPPPIAKTRGPQGTAQFLTKGAGLISQLEQRILKRVPDLSFR